MPNDPTDQQQQFTERPENEALNAPDVQSACNADAEQIRAIQLLNPDMHDGSAGGSKDDSLRIESEGKVIAARGVVALTPKDSISILELRELANAKTGGYPWAKDCLKKWEAAQSQPEGAQRDKDLAIAQDMADLMARRGPYALKDSFSIESATSAGGESDAFAPGHESIHKLSDSYSLALSTAMVQARDSDEAQQIQAQVSIDYMTKKGEEALAAMQTSVTEDADAPLVAWSSIELPKEIGSGEIVDIRLDATNAVEADEEILAQKPLEKYYLEHPEAAPIQLPKVNIGEVAGMAVQGAAVSLDQALRALRLADKATYQDLDYSACQAAIEKFPDLKKYGVNETVIAAIILNELVHKDGDDDDEDDQVRKNGHVLNPDGSENITASIGPAQMQVQNIHRLAQKYPELSLYNLDASRAALEPSIAPYFVAAYLQERVEAFAAHDLANPKEQTPKCFEALLYTYNPDVVSKVKSSDTSVKADEYREISASEKAEAKLTGHRAGSLTGWKSESYPRNLMILQKSGVVKTIKQTMQSVESHFRDK